MASTTGQAVIVLFHEDFDEQAAFEMPSRGYLSHSVVQLADGSRYPVFFIDPVRLGQELEDRREAGQPYFAEVNLIVLPEVTVEAIQKAVEALAAEGYFQHLKPLT